MTRSHEIAANLADSLARLAESPWDTAPIPPSASYPLDATQFPPPVPHRGRYPYRLYGQIQDFARDLGFQ